MVDIKDIFAGTVDIEEIVFGYGQVSSMTATTTMRYYIGAVSGERFLLIRLASPEDAQNPIDFTKSGEIHARDSENEFFNVGLAMVVRPGANPARNMEREFQPLQSFLQDCLRLCFTKVKAGTLAWEGDHFTAESAIPLPIPRTATNAGQKSLGPHVAVRFANPSPEAGGTIGAVSGSLLRDTEGRVRSILEDPSSFDGSVRRVEFDYSRSPSAPPSF
jgi:hypothetical protein